MYNIDVGMLQYTAFMFQIFPSRQDFSTSDQKSFGLQYAPPEIAVGLLIFNWLHLSKTP